MTYNEKIVDAITGEETIRPFTAEEIAAVEEEIALIAAKQAELDADQAAKIAARQAILDRLGLTADEATLLLGGN
jgi:glutamate dehydrogenase/leucine dehydrogenase